MPKQGNRVEINTFVQGLITEASPLNFPVNASKNEENFELQSDGTRKRRLGMDLETDGIFWPANVGVIAPFPCDTFVWYSVNGDTSSEFLVVRNGYTLSFLNNSSESLSGQIQEGTLFVPLSSKEWDFASIEGRLVIVSGEKDIAIVSYESGTFSYEIQNLQVRDTWGIEETVDPLYETDPSHRLEINYQHQYNLRNQSWGIPRRTGAVLDDPLLIYRGVVGAYPGNAESIWTGIVTVPPTVGATPYEELYPTLFSELLGSNLSSAKGYFVIDAFDRGASRLSQMEYNQLKYPKLASIIPGFLSDSFTGGPSLVTDFAGRVFYSGIRGFLTNGDKRSPSVTNMVFFSQLVQSTTQINKCYQEGDPTSREGNDVVDTDGGFIKISGAKEIVGMVNLGTDLVVFATNGVWSISGGAEYGFTSTNYKVTKITSFGAIGRDTIIVDGGRATYWALDGIYAVQRDQFGALHSESITQKTIQTGYDDIPEKSKKSAFGVYDESSRKLRWIYKTGEDFTMTSQTYELILDTVMGSFSKYHIQPVPSDSREIKRAFLTTDKRVKYLVYKYDGLFFQYSFSEYRDEMFRDWKSYDGIGVDAKAFLLTGSQTTGDSSIDKQVPYVTMHFQKTENGVNLDLTPKNPSGCLMRIQWSFANSIASNKWSELVQVYRYRKPLFVSDSSDPYDNGLEVITTKNKVRGRGPAFALYLETEPYKDCNILGWGVTLNANTIT